MNARWQARTALCLLAGASMRFAFAPVGFWPLAILAVATLFYLLRDQSPGRVFRFAWLFGFAMFAVGTPWVYTSIHEFGQVWAPAAALVTIGFAAVLGLFPATALAMARRLSPNGSDWIMLMPFAWVLGEWVRSWFLSGFPWLSLGYSHSDTWLIVLAPLGGVFLISLLVALLAAALARLFSHAPADKLRRWYMPTTVAVAALALVLVGRALPGPQAVGQWQVAIVQGNFGQDIKFEPEWLTPQISHYVDTTLAIDDVDLVVWPETVLPRFYDALYEPVYAPLAQHMASRDMALLAGVLERDTDSQQVHNAVVALGQAEGQYRKRKLVPLGEYFPFRPLLALLPGLQIPYSDMTPGASNQPLVRVKGEPVGVSICYEDAFGSLLLSDVPQARALVNVSNDAWFGRRAPWQHLQIARLRAAEVQRSMVRSTTTGVSALIGPGGELQALAAPFEPKVLRGEVTLYAGRTPYAIWADWPVVVLCVLGLAVGSLAQHKRRRLLSAS